MLEKRVYALILAGGGGTRLWPISRISRPKQFIDICSGGPLVKQVVSRLGKVVRKENIFIATGAAHSGWVKRHGKSLGIPLKNYFFEPVGKNSFAPIALIAQRINRFFPGAVLVVVPSDNIISNQAGFIKTLKAAIQAAKKGNIITVGTRPSRPETGYGYIKINSKSKILPQKRDPALHKASGGKNSKVFKVEEFIEKPNLDRAKKLIRDHRFYWNAGMFIFCPEIFLQEAKELQPAAMKIICQMENLSKQRNNFSRLWKKLPWISVDYAIMERTKRICLVHADFQWVDIGNWEAMRRVSCKDKSGNALKGPVVALGCKNSLIFGHKRIIAGIGLEDMVVVDTPDALLVCPRSKSQLVKGLVELLKNKNLKGLL
ncbi:MAG: sugar phosphate nucleotidyltransferase [Candidatus Omnitrophota bacterium]